MFIHGGFSGNALLSPFILIWKFYYKKRNSLTMSLKVCSLINNKTRLDLGDGPRNSAGNPLSSLANASRGTLLRKASEVTSLCHYSQAIQLSCFQRCLIFRSLQQKQNQVKFEARVPRTCQVARSHFRGACCSRRCAAGGPHAFCWASRTDLSLAFADLKPTITKSPDQTAGIWLEL